MSFTRYLEEQIVKDLQKKMVFVAGPRQIGKTTMGFNIIKEKSAYLNWDIIDHKDKILKNQLPISSAYFFDEIHKFKSWRSFLKGLYDLHRGEKKILLTGSAHLDYYRYGGDSLQGRYFYFRLHPLSVAELGIKTKNDFESLMKLGGFPEPFFSGSETEAKRFAIEYRSRLVNEDISNLENISDISKLEQLSLRLPDLVASPLSINSIREDLEISFSTASRWLNILEKNYSIFRISPFGSPKIKAIKKSQKHYHYNWSLVEDLGPRFENLVACHLLKWCSFKKETLGEDLELRYMRDSQAREVDFVICKQGKPLQFIECKLASGKKSYDIDKNIKYIKSKFPEVECIQLMAYGEKEFVSKGGIKVMPALKFLGELV